MDGWMDEVNAGNLLSDAVPVVVVTTGMIVIVITATSASAARVVVFGSLALVLPRCLHHRSGKYPCSGGGGLYLAMYECMKESLDCLWLVIVVPRSLALGVG
jgi:hypothetical protein